MSKRYTLLALALFTITNICQAQEKRGKIRDFGIHIGILPTGPNNAITDVAGVTVGQKTIIKGDSVRTGVTAIIPHQGNVF